MQIILVYFNNLNVNLGTILSRMQIKNSYKTKRYAYSCVSKYQRRILYPRPVYVWYSILLIRKSRKRILYLAIQYEYLRKTRASKPLNYGLSQKQGVYQFQCLSSEETEKHMKSRLQNIYSQHTWLNMCIQEYQTLWTSINKMLL